MKQSEQIKQIINLALQEDIGSGDITSLATIKKNQIAIGKFLVKDNGVIAGLSIAKLVFRSLDKKIKLKVLIEDGFEVKPGDVVAEVSGNARAILSAERTALNFLQRMSGIATASSIYAKAVSHTKAKVIDTRKTAPGLRMIDKIAVKIGGCDNHRLGLYDMFLIKDNHIEISGSITKAVEACRKFMRKKKKKFLIEVETKNLDEVLEALECKADMIMLDNFNIEEMRKAVELINGKCKVEASGGVNLNTIKAIAETGVDYISVGGLTHSVKALDISLEITPL
ncbi:carboxylating nicotinate-nucleotide diphosphorylase [Ignavibacterium sp.]|uniref:carboxylating nicotinate-nucleotide diphosphorylase n=1 Tax=Ignavibacterium sp. TaxID=2651167 RepID=UPI00220FCE56|nr:carboxylating nicotinate-nucleotide diphosphorylase [Ignavibacterium sp.]BDQ04203.1 MAG: nicotinate-nucleotide diphosphorylase (carboxylating) [Ignavibacterium sp.]